MENSKEIFTLALNLVSPWFVERIDFIDSSKGKELHIFISFTRGAKFTSSDGKQYTVYDTQDRNWEHLNFFQHRCFLHSRVPRVKQDDGSVKLQSVPWARPQSGFTLLFEAYIMSLIENEMPVNKVAKTVGVYPQRLWTIFNYWIEKAHNADTINDLTKVGFDETSQKKKHNYITTTVDLEDRRVLFASKGKSSECIKESVDYLKSKEVNIDNIEQICIDMSPAFIVGCKKYIPKAAVTFDKFHVVKELYKALDTLRKFERKENEILKGHKYTFLKNNLSHAVEEEKYKLLNMFPKLGEGYRLVQLFKEFWDIKDKDEAAGYLAYWCDMALDCRIKPFIHFANTIKSHWSGIVNYIESRINNGILEGINSKIQLAKRRARGYRNHKNFISMIYFLCGKLKFQYPLKTT